jgi:threonine synthase
VFDLAGAPAYRPDQVAPGLPGMWRYRAAFGLPAGAPVVTLGEGSTPLVSVERDGRPVWLKLESLNPTGSYKDRGSAVLLSQLAARGAREAVEDSSGNAGASFAAYAARAGVKARVFVPASASGPKRAQIEAYGAELVRVPGPRSAAAEAVLAAVGQGAVYASHAFLPFGLVGIATIAYEIVEQLGGVPGAVVAPAGHGGLLLGLMRGFQALQAAGLVPGLPYFAGVQAGACAPIWAGYTSGRAAMARVEEGPTAAEGVRVRAPVRAEAILALLEQAPGQILAVDEAEILPAYRELAGLGFHVEPTASLAWVALMRLQGQVSEPIVLILSGSGLKYLPTS